MTYSSTSPTSLDPEVFDVAKRTAFPSLVRNRKQPHTIRAWVPGCSSGEEVYSMAIALTEFLESQHLGCAIQMFGTDVSDRTIDVARRGIYSESAIVNVSAERRRRFFVRADSGYQVSRHIRDMCIFSRHNVASDPPFSRMDVVSCRNLLIYFSPSLQRRVISAFSYALQPDGCLDPGALETLGSLADHFTMVDEKHKIYCRKTNAGPQLLDFSDGRIDEPSGRRQDSGLVRAWRNRSVRADRSSGMPIKSCCRDLGLPASWSTRVCASPAIAGT